VFDARMYSLATTFLIKFVIAGVSVIIFANALWYYLRRLITKKESRRPKTLTSDDLNTKLHGIIHEEFRNKIEQEKNIEYKNKPNQEYNEKQPVPPTVEMIEKQIAKKKAEQKHREELEALTKIAPEIKKGLLKRIFQKKQKIPKVQKENKKGLFNIKKKTPDTMIPTIFVNPEEYKNAKPNTEDTNRPTKQTTIADAEKQEQERFNKELEELNERFEKENTPKPEQQTHEEWLAKQTPTEELINITAQKTPRKTKKPTPNKETSPPNKPISETTDTFIPSIIANPSPTEPTYYCPRHEAHFTADHECFKHTPQTETEEKTEDEKTLALMQKEKEAKAKKSEEELNKINEQIEKQNKKEEQREILERQLEQINNKLKELE
jgi:hypothetical protein